MESQSAVWLTDQNMLVNDIHTIVPIQSATVNQYHVASATIISPSADGLTVQSTGCNLSVEQPRDFI